MSRPKLARPSLQLATAWGIALVLAACADRPGQVREADTGPLVPADTGMRVVEDSAPAWGSTPQWTVGDTPTLDLGDPAQAFLGVAPVLRLSDGRIVVADGSRQTIRYFDASGTLLTVVGGRGADVDQFHGLGWIGRGPADSIVAYDFIARRLTRFDAKGKFVSVAPLRPADPRAAAEPLATFADGSILFRIGGSANPFPGKAGEALRDSADYLRFGADGEPLAAIGRFPQGESFGVKVRAEGGLSPFPVPFGLVTAAALRADTMLIGTGASFEVASIAPDGAPLGVLRAPIARQPVTAEESKEYTRKAIERVKNGPFKDLDKSLIRALEQAPFPAQKPAFGRIMTDRTGALWVSAPLDPPAPPTSWTVFAPEGTWLGQVTTPAGFRIDEIGADYLLGVFREPSGRDRVRVYPLSRAAGQ